MKTTFEIDLQKCIGQLNLSNNMNKAIIEWYIMKFVDFSWKTLQNILFNNENPYSINKNKVVNQELFSVSVKVKFKGKKPSQEILVYGIDGLKTLNRLKFSRAINEQITKIDVNNIITDFFIIIKYKF